MANNDGKVKQVILVRKDLQMSPGKTAAQVAHASLASILENKSLSINELTIPIDPELNEWLTNRFTKICLGVKDEAELLFYYQKAKEAGLRVSLIKDAGFTELSGSNYTCVAIGPNYNEKIDQITKKLQLFK